MPVFDYDQNHVDVDAPGRDVLTMGLKGLPAGFERGFHSHRKAQCFLALSGVLTVEAQSTLWIVAPHTALWIPPSIEHRIEFSGTIEGYNAFIEPTAIPNLPNTCYSVSASALLRELMLRTAQYPLELPAGGMPEHVAALLLEEIAISERSQCYLPIPSHPRPREILQSVMRNPGDHGTIEDWAKRHAMSSRSFARLIVASTGMSFGRWRQQLRIVLALQWMANGASVEQVAFDLGYESPGSFVTMFRKAMGAPPARYLAGRIHNREPREDAAS